MDVIHQSAIPGNGRVLLITGASSGIGAATARAAVLAGWRVALVARSGDRVRGLADELGRDNALPICGDVAVWSDQEAAVEATLDRWGQLDAAFANAGIGAKRGFTNESVDHWRSMILTNVLGPALTIRAARAAIIAGKGHFILTGSVAGIRAIDGSLYSATKFAVTGMAESLRQELNGTGVRTTLIAPGMVDTPFFDSSPGEWALNDGDIARAVMFAISQPAGVDVNMMLIRPTAQDL